MKKGILLPMLLIASSVMISQTIIGTTSYDVQTNNGAKHRISVYDDGRISAAWTGSTDYAVGTTNPDRGMFFNHYNGATWGAFPAARVETTKTGFGEIITVMDHEVMIAHDGAVVSQQLYANTAIGSTTWTEIGGSDDVIGFWPAAVCPEGTDDIYVLNANANPPTELRFSRSDDGGLTWTVLNTTVPFLTAADGIPGLSAGLVAAAETYQIAVYGTNVYILYGVPNSDLVLIHSPSNGAVGTWTSTVIHDFPINTYDGLAQTDVDGDFVTDVIETTDGNHNMFIDAGGDVHIYTGYVKIYNDGIGAFWSYQYEDAMGIWQWHTGMDAAEKIDLTMDWDNADGLNDPLAGIGAFRSHYRYPGIVSMPGGAIDPLTNRYYLIYTMAIEYTDLFDDPLNVSAQSYRDIFGVYSDDNGATWSTPVNLTNTAGLGKENVYTSVYPEFTGGKVHMVWQEDVYPGTTITDLDPIGVNNIMYNGWTAEDFGVTPMTCNYIVGPGGLYADGITSTSATMHWDAVDEAAQYIVAFWMADDLATVGKKRPSVNMYVIPEGKLEPETTYGYRVKTVCYEDGMISPYSEIAYFTTLPLREGESRQSIDLFPNPTDGNFNLELNGFEESETNTLILNSTGQVVYESIATPMEFNYQLPIDLSDAPAGIYYVMVSNNGNVITKTVMIN